jgi:cell division protein FtsI (penicillin-binding protein 3)
MSRRQTITRHAVRNYLVLAILLGGFGLLAARAVFLQVLNSDYLQNQGHARYTRLLKDNSHRGMILDRNGAPLAVSTPVDSVWAHPAAFNEGRDRWSTLAALLETSVPELSRLFKRRADREFMYLKRHVTPEVAERVIGLNLPGVALVREYRRYYPVGTVAGHVVGFSNIDDQGQEGLELAYDDWLRAVPGTKRVLKDLQGNAVEVVESVTLPIPGRDLVTSLDRRIQYLAYRELKSAVETHRARAGSIVVLDNRSGEVLAMVNEPDFNPNNRSQLKSQVFRNRAVTDLFEPGSTLKPFTVSAALESGKFLPSDMINTSPGTIQVGHKTIKDARDYGRLSLAKIIEKSSNVGATKIALALDKKIMWQTLQSVGFGKTSGSRLPGESAGLMNPYHNWVRLDQASLSFGYGISVTPLQLARAYAVLANDGVLPEITLLRRNTSTASASVLSAATAQRVRSMLELAVSKQGTGAAARVPDYRVAGKTGTVHKLTADGYADDHYVAWFAGFAPASDPRLVMVVTVDEPKRGGYFGGEIAAPVFSRVMTGALRLLDIPPDAPRGQPPPTLTARNGEDT